jgi:Family of unknown function (DUF6304)
MEWKYPTRFTDRWGSERTTIRNDGAELSVTLRGVQFSGPDFDSLEADPPTPEELLTKFLVSPCGCLCGCVFDIEIETPVLVEGEETAGVLTAHLELGEPTQSGALDRETLRLLLRVNDNDYSSEGTDGFFENELQSLQHRMPVGMQLKMCFSCAHSDYHPVGHGLFGDMACFRNAKAEYSGVRNKGDLFRVWSKRERVQETYLCGEFSPRKPNTGYRG